MFKRTRTGSYNIYILWSILVTKAGGIGIFLLINFPMMTQWMCGLLRRKGVSSLIMSQMWFLSIALSGCQAALCPPLKFNYQAHWVFNSSLILFSWQWHKRSLHCHLCESLKTAEQLINCSAVRLLCLYCPFPFGLYTARLQQWVRSELKLLLVFFWVCVCEECLHDKTIFMPFLPNEEEKRKTISISISLPKNCLINLLIWVLFS